MGRFLPSMPMTVFAMSFMDTISSLPMLRGSVKSDFVRLQADKGVNYSMVTSKL